MIQEELLVTNNNIITKNIDNEYNEIYIYRLIKGIDFGIEVNIYYK